MTELALAEQQRKLHDRLLALELRVELLARALGAATSGSLDRPEPVTRWVEPQPWQVTSTGGAL